MIESDRRGPNSVLKSDDIRGLPPAVVPIAAMYTN